MDSFWSVLLAALIEVESHGNPNAVGDHGKAIGCLQIHKEVVADVNHIYNTNFRHKTAFDPAVAKIIAELYLTHYGQWYKNQAWTGADYGGNGPDVARRTIRLEEGINKSLLAQGPRSNQTTRKGTEMRWGRIKVDEIAYHRQKTA